MTFLLSLALIAADHPPDPPRYCAQPLHIPLASSTSPLAEQVVRHFAPTFYQETLDPVRDYIAAFDFDGDWDGANNPSHVADFPLRAQVYYSVVDTATHWFVQYMPYHPVDYKRIGGHAHDTESVLMIIRKPGRGEQSEPSRLPRAGGERDAPNDDGGLGTLEAMETRFHQFWYQYRADARVQSGADDVDGPVHYAEDGHPAVYAQRAGHGLCGGFAPTAFLREFELQCDHARPPHLAEAGVVYRYKGRAEVPRPGLTVQEVGYDLVDMQGTIWAHRDDAHAFGRAIAYHGARCEAHRWSCPANLGTFFRSTPGNGITADTAEAPWGQTPGRGSSARGEQFFDPAYTMSKRLSFPAPFSLEYENNPYLALTVAHR